MSEKFDLIVLGGGRAANLAMPAAKAGMKTLLIERDLLGGSCPNRGCVPSKLLIGFAEAARHVRDANRHFRGKALGQTVSFNGDTIPAPVPNRPPVAAVKAVAVVGNHTRGPCFGCAEAVLPGPMGNKAKGQG